jgi:hypothetical protein
MKNVDPIITAPTTPGLSAQLSLATTTTNCQLYIKLKMFQDLILRINDFILLKIINSILVELMKVLLIVQV